MQPAFDWDPIARVGRCYAAATRPDVQDFANVVAEDAIYFGIKDWAYIGGGLVGSTNCAAKTAVALNQVCVEWHNGVLP